MPPIEVSKSKATNVLRLPVIITVLASLLTSRGLGSFTKSQRSGRKTIHTMTLISISNPNENPVAMFRRTWSTNCASSIRKFLGTQQPYDKYHPNLVAEMTSQTVVAEADTQVITTSSTNILGHLQSISRGGEIVLVDSFLSRGYNYVANHDIRGRDDTRSYRVASSLGKCGSSARRSS